MNEPYHIIVLDDNPSFLRGYHYRLMAHFRSLQVFLNCKVDITACTTTLDFFKLVRPKRSLLVLDYKLGNGMNAGLLLSFLKSRGQEHDAIIISEGKVEAEQFGRYQKHIKGILRKDALLVPRSCMMIEDYLSTALRT